MGSAPSTETAHDLPGGGLDWLAPARLLCTQRAGGVSRGAYASNNLGLHVNDRPEDVFVNRSQLIEYKDLSKVQWLNQVHGTRVVAVGSGGFDAPTADAMYTTERGLGLAILTADCLPVALVDCQGEVVAAAHAGWRGFCAGVLGALVAALPVPASRLRAFIGPAIGQSAFEVGPEVVVALDNYGIDLTAVVRPVTVANEQSGISPEPSTGNEKYRVDLVQAAVLDLQRLGVEQISGGHWCTASDKRFYSWRRETHRARSVGEAPATGRQATVVWLP